jgi:isopentenyldiphosphate isomerase
MNLGERANDEEIFDVLNEDQKVVRQATRIECHKKGHFHQSVHVLIWDSGSKKVLLQKRAKSKRIAPGKRNKKEKKSLG